MYPGFLHHWRRAHACAHHAAHADGAHSYHAGEHGPPGPGFGVRRPLRVMSHELELDSDQVEKLARLIDDLKIERAQAAVHERRSLGLVADALLESDFDGAKVESALDLRVQAAQKLRDAVRDTLRETHAMLKPEQRKKLAYLLRSGTITI
jgi:Spy/CpxP family protein refolding chaperone